MILHVFCIFISAINMLSIITLSFMYIKSNICDTSEFSSDSIFVSSGCNFFFSPFCNCPAIIIIIFFWTASHKCRHWDIYTTYIYIYKIFVKAYLIYLYLDMCMPFFPETKIMGLCVNKVRSWELKFPVTAFLSNYHRLHIPLLTGFISLVQFSYSVMSNSLQPHGLQHARLPCSSPTPRACSNSCPLSRWCHPTI